MSKRHRGDRPATDWESERTLEAAEADTSARSAAGEFRCLCGSADLLLQAYYAVSDGRVASEPLELEGLTCPECGREYEAVAMEDGRIARGELVGLESLDDDLDLD